MELNSILFSAGFFLAGLLTGSFLNVLIYKIPRKIRIFKPYSICYACKNKSSLISNFPVIAYIFKRGKCKYCNEKIPVKNIIVEIITAVLFLVTYLIFSISIGTAAGIVLTSSLIVISFIDWEFMIIPNLIVFPLTIVGLVFSISANPSKWWMPLAFSAGAFVFMLIIHLIYPKGMGMGDVKLAMMLGAFLVKNIIAGIFLGFLIGSIAGLIFIGLKKKTLKQYIPFGPFISMGGLIAFFAGNQISGWYTGFF